MSKAINTYTKLAEDVSGVMELTGRSLADKTVPLIGSYFGTEKKKRKEHPVIATLFGPLASEGAVAKDTGKSNLTNTAAAGGISGAVAGGVSSAVLNRLVGKELAGPMSKSVLEGARSGTVYGILAGAGLYGLGHALATKKDKKN